MRISRRRPILGQESFVPEWGLPILGVLGVCFLILIVMTPVAMVRTQRGRSAARAGGIRVEGVMASTSFKLVITPENLRDDIRSIVQSQRRFSKVEETPGGVVVYVRGNVWTWGEVIEVIFTETADGTQVNATCRPRLTTTLFDYGQGGSDLALFKGLLIQRTESGQRGYNH